MSEKKTLSTRFSELVHKNSFLKVISVLLAVVVWIYILYVINPVNDKEFNRIAVDLSFEGSIPERNGYMYLLTDTNLTVSVNVSGSRSDLFNLTAADIKASLNLDPITTAGTHSVAVNISTKNKSLEITDYNPKSFTIEFASVAQRTIPVEWQAAGTLPDGYSVKESGVSPKEITVTGPANTVESIAKVYVSVPVTNVKDDTTGSYDIFIVNEKGENVDRRFLTISDTKAEANLSVFYSKDLKTNLEILNTSGGNESSYISVTLDTPMLKAIGGEKVLSALDTLDITTIDTSKLEKGGTVELSVPEIEGVTFDKTTVNATITFAEDLGTKEIKFDAKKIMCNNLPSGIAADIKAPVTVKIRAKNEDLKNLSADDFSCVIDYKTKLPNGFYPVIIYPVASNTAAFGVVGSYALTDTEVIIYETRSY